MSLKTKISEARHAFSSTGQVMRDGFKLVAANPTMLVYPKLASAVVPPLAGLLLALTYWLVNHPLHVGQHALRIFLATGILGYLYTGFLSSYFTCAVVATALSELDGSAGTPVISQFGKIKDRFWRITRFGLSAFLFPIIAIYARRKEVRKSPVMTIAGSLTLSMAWLAPAIMSRREGIAETIRSTNRIMGPTWQQGLIIKVLMYLSILVVGSIGFLPKLIQHYWFNGSTAHLVGWLASTLLWVVSFVLIRVISSVFIAVLYHKAVHHQL